MNVFDPSKSMNAFAQGAQIGGGIRQRQTEAKLAPMVAAGDYQGAAQYAGQRGDLPSAELYRTQYGEQLKGMKAEELAAAKERAESLARTAAGLRSVPYEQRRATLQQQLPMLQGMGIDPQQLAQFDPTDQAIDGVLAQVTPLADLLKSPEYYAPTEITGPDGKTTLGQFSKAGGAPQISGYAPAPKPESLPSGMRMGANGEPEWIPGFLEAQERLRAAGRSSVDVTVGGGSGENPYANLPDGTIIEGPPGTANLTGGQFWTVQGGRPVIANAEGGAAQSAIEEEETKRLGRQASTQRAGATVVREVGRGLELMPKIIGWGEARPGGETETTGPGEVLTANARIAASRIPGTAEYQFMNNIESALSNVGLDVLQNMRDNSPTGGALGQVPIQQQQRLEQVLGAFKIGMPRPVIEENLKYMNNAYMDIMYGSRPEREALVRQGRLTPEQNAQIEDAYYDLNWDKFGRMAPPAAAVDALKANPNLKDQFEAKYGEGSAAKFLGGQ